MFLFIDRIWILLLSLMINTFFQLVILNGSLSDSSRRRWGGRVRSLSSIQPVFLSRTFLIPIFISSWTFPIPLRTVFLFSWTIFIFPRVTTRPSRTGSVSSRTPCFLLPYTRLAYNQGLLFRTQNSFIPRANADRIF